jgi:hypothetical protein
LGDNYRTKPLTSSIQQRSQIAKTRNPMSSTDPEWREFMNVSVHPPIARTIKTQAAERENVRF